MMNENEVQEKLTRIRQLRAALAPALAELEEIEGEVKAAVLEWGRSFECDGVTAAYRSESVRVTWDAKALDGFAVAYKPLLKFRKETTVKPSVAITVRQR